MSCPKLVSLLPDALLGGRWRLKAEDVQKGKVWGPKVGELVMGPQGWRTHTHTHKRRREGAPRSQWGQQVPFYRYTEWPPQTITNVASESGGVGKSSQVPPCKLKSL